MSRQLYEEALAEVKQLKQLAEDNARQAVLDEVTPRIKQLIEQNIASLDEQPMVENKSSAPRASKEHKISPAAREMLQNVLGKGPYTKDSIRTAANFFSVYPLPKTVVEGKKVSEVLEGLYIIASNSLTESAFATVRPVLETTYNKVNKQVTKLKSISEAKLNIQIDGFSDEDLDSDTLNKLNITIVPEVEGAEAEAGAEAAPGAEADTEPTPEAGAEEAPPAAPEAGAEAAPEGGAPAPEETPEETPEEPVKKEGRNMDKFAMLSDDTVVEIDEGMLRREIARMKALREAKEGGMPKASKNAPKGHGVKGTEKHFGGGKEEGEAFLDGESFFDSDDLMESLDESDVLEVVDEAELDEKAHMNADEGDLDEAELDEVVTELAGMMGHKDDEGMGHGHEFGGGHKASASHLDDEGDLDLEGYGMDEAEMVEAELDELQQHRGSDELGQAEYESHASRGSMGMVGHTESFKRQSAALIEARKKAHSVAVRAKSLKNESVYRRAVAQYNKASEALKALQESARRSNSAGSQEVNTLRNQLAETNLFNAKLLYTNKLLQNEALSARQKVAVIEKLDEARSLREAKLVYESLTRTIASGKASVNEGADRQVLGSASRATRPSSTVSLNEGVETARWARLAGIK